MFFQYFNSGNYLGILGGQNLELGNSYFFILEIIFGILEGQKLETIIFLFLILETLIPELKN